MKGKFKIGDKIKIISATQGSFGANGEIGIVTDKNGNNGISRNKKGFNVETKNGSIWRIGYESKCELLESVTDQITINRYGNKVVAKMGNKTGVARCNETDTFDLYTGVKIATDRLFGKEELKVKEVKRHAKVGEYVKIVRASAVPETNGNPDYKNGDILKVIDAYVRFSQVRYAENDSQSNRNRVLNDYEYVVLENYKPQTEKPQEEKPKYYNGKVVCIGTGGLKIFTVGKIYEFKNGVSIADDRIKTDHYYSLEEFHNLNPSYKFIELVEDK